MEGLTIQSTGNKMLIVMTSDEKEGGQDDEIHYRGFSAQITMKAKFRTNRTKRPKTTPTTTTTTTTGTTTTTEAVITTTETKRNKKKNKKQQKTTTTEQVTTTEQPSTTTTTVAETEAPQTTTTTTETLLGDTEVIETATTTSSAAKLTSAEVAQPTDSSKTNEDNETVEFKQSGPSGFMKYGHYVIAAVVGSCVIALTCFAIYRMRKRRYSGHDLVPTEKI